MNPQPANAYPDARINQILEALRTTEPPAGLEERVAQRINARLAQPAQARTQSATANSAPAFYWAVILNAVKDPCILLAEAKLYTLAAATLTLLIALTTLTFLHHRPQTIADTTAAHKSTVPTSVRITPTVLTATSISGLEAAGHESRIAPAHTTASAAEGISTAANTQIPQGFNLESHPSRANTQVPQGFSLGSHSSLQRVGVLTPASQQPANPDAIALAETLAPSRPAPPMPLTSQEHLMLAVTRPGQPIQLAELDTARAPHLRAAAEARETASIDRYVKSLLAPFAVADKLSPTTFSQPQETSTPAPPPPPSNASPN